MANDWFRFRQFTIWQQHCAMKVSTDACLFAAWVAKRLGQQVEPHRIIDIGAGSGVLSLMLAQRFEKAWVDALELDVPAAQEAEKNFSISSFSTRVRLLNADARNWKGEHQYDLLISNPPFHQNHLLSPNHDRKNNAHHQLTLRLHEVLDTMVNNMNPAGMLALMLPAYCDELLRTLLPERQLCVANGCTIRSKPNQAPRIRLYLIGKSPGQESEECITIGEEDGSYSRAFKDLMRPYYLHV